MGRGKRVKAGKGTGGKTCYRQDKGEGWGWPLTNGEEKDEDGRGQRTVTTEEKLRTEKKKKAMPRKPSERATKEGRKGATEPVPNEGRQPPTPEESELHTTEKHIRRQAARRDHSHPAPKEGEPNRCKGSKQAKQNDRD